MGRKKGREIQTETGPEEAAPDTGEASALKEAVLALPELERMPILLHYVEGLSIAEIASALHCPRGTILSRMDRGRRHLRQSLGED